MKKGLLFLFVFVFQMNIDASFRAMMNQNLSVYPYEEPEWPSNDTRWGDFLKFAINLQENLQEFSKRRVPFLMLKRYLEKYPISYEKMIVDGTTWKDLNIFCGQTDPKKYFADIIDRTNTIFGKIFLYFLIANPTTNIDVLQKRQAVIRVLLQNEELFKKLSLELKNFKKIENLFISFWLHDPFKNATDRKYFKLGFKKIDAYLNQNLLCLNTRSFCEHQQRCLLAAATIVAAVVLPISGIEKMFNQNVLPEAQNNLADRLKNSGGALVGVLNYFFEQKPAVACLMIASGIINALYVKETVHWSVDNFKLEKLMHYKIQQIARGFNALKNIYAAVKDNEIIQKNWEELHHLENIFEKTEKEIDEFLKILKPYSSLKYHDLFVNKGKILMLFRKFYDIKEKFEECLIALGSIDCFVSLAELYKEGKGLNQYCFVDFSQATQPFLKLENFWNPCVQKDIIVSNNISLGEQNATGMIITGPNAGGKSTLLKSLAFCITMAQSFGIVPASTAKMTPYSLLMSYLNIVDDLSGGNSLFKSQVLRLQEIIQAVHALSPHQNGCVLLDEMLNGTSHKEAQACAFSVAQQLGSYQNLFNLIATHYELLTQLESYDYHYKNYHVNVIKDVDGKLMYPFKLELGISNQHVALDILSNEDGFDKAMLQNAQTILDSW